MPTIKIPVNVTQASASLVQSNTSDLVAQLTPQQQAAINYQDGDCTDLEPYGAAGGNGRTITYGGTPSAAGDRLFRVGGQWHLISAHDPNPPTCKRTWQGTTWRDVAAQPSYGSDPIFVGPTPIDQASITTPDNAPSEVTTLTSPAEIPKGWIPVIKEMIDSFLEACKGKSYDFGTMVNSYTGDSSLQMPFPDTLRRIADAAAHGMSAPVNQPSSCGVGTPQRCLTDHQEFAYGFFPSMFSEDLVQGYLQQWSAKNTPWDGSLYTDPDGAVWWHGTDESGNSVTYVKHPKGVATTPGSYVGSQDPNTYKVYTLYDWADYLGLDLPETMALAYFQGYMEEELTNLQADWLGTREVGSGGSPAVPNTRPPLARWDNPAEEDNSINPWGYWLILSELNQLTGLWDTDRDRPGQFYMFIMYSRIPQCNWWCEIVQALEWVDQLLIDIASAVAGTVEQLMNILVCDGNPSQLLALTKGNAAALGAITLIKTQCPSTSVDCTNPANAAAAACQPPSGAIPWYVWLGGGVVLIAIIAAARSKGGST